MQPQPLKPYRTVIHNPKMHRPVPLVHVPGLPPKETASIPTKFGRLRREATHWARSGFPRVDRATRLMRQAHCTVCAYYDSGGNAGLGECRAPGCGCTGVKWRLATSECPLPEPHKKWHATVKPDVKKGAA